jgi:hypothetical protein
MMMMLAHAAGTPTCVDTKETSMTTGTQLQSGFDSRLAESLSMLNLQLNESSDARKAFTADPTGVATAFLQEHGMEPPEMFHAHAIAAGETLPAEPDRATRERYVYIFRKSGLFEFKQVPGSPDGDDSIMANPRANCQCCNCCVMEV